MANMGLRVELATMLLDANPTQPFVIDDVRRLVHQRCAVRAAPPSRLCIIRLFVTPCGEAVARCDKPMLRVFLLNNSFRVFKNLLLPPPHVTPLIAASRHVRSAAFGLVALVRRDGCAHAVRQPQREPGAAGAGPGPVPPGRVAGQQGRGARSTASAAVAAGGGPLRSRCLMPAMCRVCMRRCLPPGRGDAARAAGSQPHVQVQQRRKARVHVQRRRRTEPSRAERTEPSLGCWVAVAVLLLRGSRCSRPSCRAVVVFRLRLGAEL
jgi:hypothetical protein